jgi:hypothetical protein
MFHVEHSIKASPMSRSAIRAVERQCFLTAEHAENAEKIERNA